MEVRRLCEQWQQDDGLPNPGGTVPADQAAPGARERPQWPQGDPTGVRPESDRGGPGTG